MGTTRPFSTCGLVHSEGHAATEPRALLVAHVHSLVLAPADTRALALAPPRYTSTIISEDVTRPMSQIAPAAGELAVLPEDLDRLLQPDLSKQRRAGTQVRRARASASVPRRGGSASELRES